MSVTHSAHEGAPLRKWAEMLLLSRNLLYVLERRVGPVAWVICLEPRAFEAPRLRGASNTTKYGRTCQEELRSSPPLLVGTPDRRLPTHLRIFLHNGAQCRTT